MRWNHLVRVSIAATTVALLVGLAAAPVAAGSPGRNVRFVDDDGLADSVHGCAGTGMAFLEIQLAIDDSDANDVVKVCPGTYREHVTIAGKPGLILEAVRPWTATVKPPIVVAAATGTAGFSPAVIDISSNGAVVRWLNVVVPATGDCNYFMNGIIVDGAHNVVLRGNRLAGGAGDPVACGLLDPIIFINSASGLVGFNVLSRFSDTGIFVGSGSDVRVYQNSIRFFGHVSCSVTAVTCATGNSPAGNIGTVGVGVYDDATATIRRNVFKEVPSTGTSTSFDLGILVSNSSAHVTLNRIRGLYWGIDFNSVDSGSIRLNRVSGGTSTGVLLFETTGITVARNRVFNRGGGGIFVNSDSDSNTIRNNDFSGNDDVDCTDNSGPSNTWTNDLGDESSPAGLCTPAP